MLFAEGSGRIPSEPEMLSEIDLAHVFIINNLARVRPRRVPGLR